MRRKRSTPWIHRWSRPLMAGIASIGAAVTAYLTYSKLAGNEAACPTGGCDIVLSSPYAYVFGLPLSLFGFLGYLSMIVFAVAPLLVNPTEQKSLRSKLESWTGLFMFAGSTAMTIFSGYLMYVLAVDIKAACIYCIASALFATSLFVLALIGREWDDIGQLFFIGILVSMLVLISSLALYADVNNLGTAKETSMKTTTSSGSSEIALAQHLKIVGAKMYGSFTCDHCQAQKESFGKEAAGIINYIECNTQGKNARRDLCEAAKIQATPTWEINGKFYRGQKSLQELADLSGYQGTREFRNLSNQER
ncbi:vitamin K epoxide reductase family protein [Microcoleus sp. AT9b-C3]|uniref:vitamin K epoxide reductase family protein n=1 Tax=Microcoleus sp. AT9b-C3 TaxID=2818629 RepID=UPI002FD68FB8